MKKTLLFLFASMLILGAVGCNQAAKEEENPNPNAGAAPGPEASDQVGNASVGAPSNELSVNPNAKPQNAGSALGGR